MGFSFPLMRTASGGILSMKARMDVWASTLSLKNGNAAPVPTRVASLPTTQLALDLKVRSQAEVGVTVAGMKNRLKQAMASPPDAATQGILRDDLASLHQMVDDARTKLTTLGDTSARGFSVMLNWIGELPDADAILRQAGAHWHDYGKDPREGRKVGHATVCADDGSTLMDRLRAIGEALGREDQVAPVLHVLKR